ncbi:MAG: hypothetical protein O2931_01600 [Planctomycetota bacterium]|nr:hypothetical protein [Planctomycetota bacterium]MDA1177467.1 hypothetical protein [Planctomycetota bacterium]
MLANLWLPIVLSAVALFFASFLSWMILQLHKQDWIKIPQEDEFLAAVSRMGLPPGNYMFPACDTPEQMKSEEFQKKWKSGPSGVITIFSDVNMGKNLGWTFVYFLVVSFCLAYLATLGVRPGAGFMDVFRFVSTAGLMTFLSAIVPHAVWFHCRIVGHVIESVVFAAIAGGIFAVFWPAGV